LADEPPTLEYLAGEFNVSRERIRQIETLAFEKVQKATKKRFAEATVHVQPRSKDFSPNSSANEAEQKRLSTFDAKQQKLAARWTRNPTFAAAGSPKLYAPPPEGLTHVR
jgi:hypothetical protein